MSGRPTLFRNNEEIAEDVEQLQVLYGVDATLDGRVDRYLTAAQIATDTGVTLDNVVAIRVELLLSSGEEDNLTEQPASAGLRRRYLHRPRR